MLETKDLSTLHKKKKKGVSLNFISLYVSLLVSSNPKMITPTGRNPPRRRRRAAQREFQEVHCSLGACLNSCKVPMLLK